MLRPTSKKGTKSYTHEWRKYDGVFYRTNQPFFAIQKLDDNRRWVDYAENGKVLYFATPEARDRKLDQLRPPKPKPVPIVTPLTAAKRRKAEIERKLKSFSPNATVMSILKLNREYNALLDKIHELENWP